MKDREKMVRDGGKENFFMIMDFNMMGRLFRITSMGRA